MTDYLKTLAPLCELLGQIFSFGFHTYLLSCIISPFALRYFVNYAPWLRAVCKFGYSLLSRAFASVLTCFISVTVFLQ